MPKPVATPDRTARTVRSPPELIERVDAVAFRRRAAFNEVANSFLVDGVRLAALDDDLQEILVEAGETASRILAAGPALTGNARLLNAQRVMRLAVSEAVARKLAPKKPMLATMLWAGAVEIVDELGLMGEPWDAITSMRSTSPPLTDSQMKLLEAGLNSRAKGADDHTKERLDTLAAYAAHAQQQHLEDWDDLKKEARRDLDVALGVTERGGRDA